MTERAAIKYLTSLCVAESRRRYPNVPYHVPAKIDVRSTGGLTSAVLLFLRLRGHHAERTGNQGRVIDKRKTYVDTVGITRTIGSVHRVHGSGLRGTSDIKAVINGKFIALEVKNARTHDRQSQAQKTYQARVEASGGVYVLVTDFASFLDWYESFIQKVRNEQ